MSNKAFSTLTDEQVEQIVKNPISIDNKSKYLILFEGEYVSNECENFRTFELVVGRQKAYDCIKEWLIGEEDTGIRISLQKSRILVEPEMITEKTPRITLSNMLNLYQFMKEMLRSGKIVDNDSSFDIEEYYEEEVTDESDDNDYI